MSGQCGAEGFFTPLRVIYPGDLLLAAASGLCQQHELEKP
jgi:hypothetical protein